MQLRNQKVLSISNANSSSKRQSGVIKVQTSTQGDGFSILWRNVYAENEHKFYTNTFILKKDKVQFERMLAESTKMYGEWP